MKNFNFSIHERADYNLKIQKDLDIIKKIIVNRVEDVLNIILVGGFGRGEGSIILFENKIIPINDYDFVIITFNYLSNKIINDIKKEILNQVGIRQIDIVNIQKKNLKKIKNSIFNYDLKYASYNLYGDTKIYELIPSINSKMSFDEIKRPLFVYLSALLLSFPKKQNYSLYSTIEKFWVFQQITKSILGWSMSKLCFINNYDPSYKNRNLNFQKFFKDNSDECKLVDIATSFKLNPTINIPKNLEDIWHINKKIHLDTLFNFYNKRNIFKEVNLNMIVKNYKYEFSNIIKILYGYIFKNSSYKNHIHLMSSIIYLLISYQNNYTKSVDLTKTINELKKMNIFLDKNIKIENLVNKLISIDPNCHRFINTENFY